MKKKYMNQTMMVVELNSHQQLLAGSDPKVGSPFSGGAILAPRRGADSDDEDEDY